MGGAILFLGLAACRAEPAADAPMEPANIASEAVPPPPDADINASLGILGAEPEMPDEAGEVRRFVGRWAAQEGLCENAAWTFTATEMRTPSGSVCRFTEIQDAPGGYDIAARCTAEGPERDDLLELRFAESASALLFASQSVADSGLIRCED